MLNYNEITPRKYIELDGDPYEVIGSQVSRKQANKPVNKTKIKSLISGRVVEKVFHVSDKAKEANEKLTDSTSSIPQPGPVAVPAPSGPPKPSVEKFSV